MIVNKFCFDFCSQFPAGAKVFIPPGMRDVLRQNSDGTTRRDIVRFGLCAKGVVTQVFGDRRRVKSQEGDEVMLPEIAP